MSPFEVLAAALVVWTFVAWCGHLDRGLTQRAFGSRPAGLEMPLTLFASFVSFVVFLMPTSLGASVQTGAALLAATVTVSLIHLLQILDSPPHLSFVLLVLASANALRSRGGVARLPSLAVALFATIASLVAHALMRG